VGTGGERGREIGGGEVRNGGRKVERERYVIIL